MNTMPTALQALNMASALMQGDPETFKAGYDLENAVLAVTEHFNLEEDETDQIRRILLNRQR